MGRFIKPLIAFFLINVILIWVFSVISYLLTNYFWLKWINNLLVALVFWFWGSIISFLLSIWFIRWSYNIIDVNDDNINDLDLIYWWKISYLYSRLRTLNTDYNENVKLAIYESDEPNAFAAWCWLCWKMIAFSSWILNLMDKNELDWVLWHEFAHVRNWDMTTMTILMWFLNTFVIYISRIISDFLTPKDENWNPTLIWTLINFVLTIILEIIFWIIVTIIAAYYSRIREYAADKDSALKYSTRDNMIAWLKKLLSFQNQYVNYDDWLNMFKISNNTKILNLFSTHPPLEDRINKLLNLK